jgi:hypothetical protein
MQGSFSLEDKIWGQKADEQMWDSNIQNPEIHVGFQQSNFFPVD